LFSRPLTSVCPDHDGDEQIRNARPAHLSERGELGAIGMIEQQDAAAGPLLPLNLPYDGTSVGKPA
jgi:hypothetical protein